MVGTHRTSWSIAFAFIAVMSFFYVEWETEEEEKLNV
jgi:hypothetical protein